MRFFAKNIRVGLLEFGLVEGVSEALAALVDLLLDLLLYLGEIILDQHVGTVSFLGILVVDERIVERRHVAGRHPGLGVHEHAGIDAHDILVEAGHRLPPVPLDVVLELDAHLAVVVYGGESVINFTRRENESVLLAMGYENLEKFILCHIFYSF